MMGLPIDTASCAPCTPVLRVAAGGPAKGREHLQRRKNGSLSYPLAWPAGGSTLLGAYSSAPPLTPPYTLFSPTAKPTISGSAPYNPVFCKAFGATGLPIVADTGIELTDVGNRTGSIFEGFVLNDGRVLFDRLKFGIWAKDAQLKVGNTIFTEMYADSVGALNGCGIYAVRAGVAYPRKLTVDTCQFYNCTYGISSTNYSLVQISNNKLYSNHTLSALTSRTVNGNYGVWLNYNNGGFSGYRVTGNYMANINNGVYFATTTEASVGNVTIDSNQILGSYPSFTGAYCNNAITLNCAAAGTGTSPNFMNTNGNALYDVYNGILINNFYTHKSKSLGNNIQLALNTTSLLGGGGEQFGIKHSGCKNNAVRGNYVTAGGSTFTNMRGISLNNNMTDTISCNETQNTERGFNFIGATNFAQWHHNDMRGHAYGYFLNGVIGPQGNTSVPSDNRWTYTWSGAMYQTYTTGSSLVASSPLYVRAGTLFQPTLNSAFPALTPYIYNSSSGGGLNVITTSTEFVPCAPTDTAFPVSLLLESLVYGQKDDSTMDDTSGQNQRGAQPIYISERVQWIAQMAVFRAITYDSGLMSTSPLLRAFYTEAQHSRYAWLTEIGENLANGDFEAATLLINQPIDSLVNTIADTATGLVMNDSRQADYVVNNYLDFYKVYRKYITDSLNSDDSIIITTLAGMCPGYDGMVVYGARALYSAVFGTSIDATDECTIDSSGFSRSVHHNPEVKTEQGYTIYPNPNDGNLKIVQSIVDDKPAKVQIWNIVGDLQYDISCIFKDGILDVRLPDAKAGVYLITIIDAKGQTFHFKFVKQ